MVVIRLSVTINGESVSRVRRRLGQAAGGLLAALRSGLAAGLEHAASEVKLAGYVAGLHRTGTLLSEIGHRMDAAPAASGAVGLPRENQAEAYSYLLTDETKTILPRKGEALTIPTGANLTGGGAVKYSSVEELRRVFGQRVVRPKGSRYIGVASRSGRGSFALYFVLVSRATVKGRNVLEPAVQGAGDMIRRLVQGAVDELLGRAT